jgi:hypothetical protein
MNWCGLGEIALFCFLEPNQQYQIAGLKHVAGDKWNFSKISMRWVQC